jgi:hypothetical protein
VKVSNVPEWEIPLHGHMDSERLCKTGHGPVCAVILLKAKGHFAVIKRCLMQHFDFCGR